jgi:hypothetical protein
MGVGLVRHQKSCSGDDAGGSGGQGRAGVGAAGHSAGEEHRTLPGDRASMGQKVESRHGSDEMAAGLPPLSDQTVGAPVDSLARLRLGTDHHEDEDAGIAKVVDQPAVSAECQHHHVDRGVDAHRDVAPTREGHHQVHRDGATRGLGTYLTD